MLAAIFLLLFIGFIFFFTWTTTVTTNLDSYVYDLPYKKGTEHRIVQGYGGLFSHDHIAAIDFAMPVGTEVFAARPGYVYAYKDDSSVGGPFPKYKGQANYLIIKHEDGSFGCYWHLKKKGVFARSGYVRKGALIGSSGATGFIFKPHLHFSVKRILNYDMNSFVRTRFKTSEGNKLLQVWRVYQRP